MASRITCRALDRSPTITYDFNTVAPNLNVPSEYLLLSRAVLAERQRPSLPFTATTPASGPPLPTPQRFSIMAFGSMLHQDQPPLAELGTSGISPDQVFDCRILHPI